MQQIIHTSNDPTLFTLDVIITTFSLQYIVIVITLNPNIQNKSKLKAERACLRRDLIQIFSSLTLAMTGIFINMNKIIDFLNTGLKLMLSKVVDKKF
jgi:uncharacterized protein YccT (UPF0319 family)